MKLIKFEADWCAPCKMYSPIFEKVVKENGLNHQIVNVDEDIELANKFSVRSVPTTIIVDEQEKELGRSLGVISESELVDFIDQNR